MKKIITVGMIAACTLFLSGCASTTVQRIEAEKTVDLSGYWNDTDLNIVCEDLIKQCLDAKWYNVWGMYNKNKLPVIIVGNFKNNSDEHLDTSLIAKKMEYALINSGKVTSVASSSERQDVRTERNEQQDNSSIETAKRLGYETAADFMLRGDIKTIIDSNGTVSTRTYYVSAELINIETNTKIWVGENSSIKKKITRPKVSF